MIYGDPQQQHQQQRQQLQHHQQHPGGGEFQRGPLLPPPPPPQMMHQHQPSASSTNLAPPEYHHPSGPAPPPVPPPYDAHADGFAAKRMRKLTQRRAVDYTSTVVRYMQVRMWQRNSRDRMILQPTPAAAVDVSIPLLFIFYLSYFLKNGRL